MKDKNLKNLIFVDCEAEGKSPSTGNLTEFGEESEIFTLDLSEISQDPIHGRNYELRRTTITQLTTQWVILRRLSEY